MRDSIGDACVIQMSDLSDEQWRGGGDLRTTREEDDDEWMGRIQTGPQDDIIYRSFRLRRHFPSRGRTRRDCGSIQSWLDEREPDPLRTASASHSVLGKENRVPTESSSPTFAVPSLVLPLPFDLGLLGGLARVARLRVVPAFARVRDGLDSGGGGRLVMTTSTFIRFAG